MRKALYLGLPAGLAVLLLLWHRAATGPAGPALHGTAPGVVNTSEPAQEPAPGPVAPAEPDPAGAGPGSGPAAVASEALPAPAARRARPPLADPEVRQKTVSRIAARERAEKEALLRHAADKGWAVRSETNGTSTELMFIRNGKIYANETLNREAAISTAAAAVRRAPPYEADGSGVRVGIWDQGCARVTHQEFGGRVTVRDNATAHYHSTHVAGTIGASGVVARATGMAPAADLDAYEWNLEVAELTERAMSVPGEADRIQISSHSYGSVSGWTQGSWGGHPYGWYWWGTWGPRESDNFGIYDDLARDWDEVAYNAPYFLVFKSAGNDRDDGKPSSGGTFRYFEGDDWHATNYNPAVHPYADGWDGGFDTVPIRGNAKNIVTVGSVADAVSGGVRDTGEAAMASYSGWGPADDGRVKPDLVANGQSLYSTDSDSDDSYATLSGTSMASPNAAGSAALVAQYYQTLFPGRVLLSSSLKGLILHTADDLGRAGPDYSFGWGLMNAQAAADLLLDHSDYPCGRFHEAALSATNAADTYSFVWDGETPIKVTVCWTDPPGPALTGTDNRTPVLVNDLDLRLVGPAGATNDPYVLSVTNPAADAVTGDNTVDNIEQIRVGAPTSGAWRVRVSHKGSLSGEEQRYSLLIDGAASTPAIAHEPLQNTSQTTGVYHVDAVLRSRTALDPAARHVYWNTNGLTNAFSAAPLVLLSNEVYRAALPAQPLGTEVCYYLSAATVVDTAAADPAGAPAALHRFEVTESVPLWIMGEPAEYGVVSPDYGEHSVASGSTVYASASLYASETPTHRFACVGWESVGGAPPDGPSNSVSFRIRALSILEWQWQSQYSLAQTSSVPGILATSTWWEAGSSAETEHAVPSATVGGTNFHFAEWWVDGARQPDATNATLNPASGIAMSTARQAQALYLPADRDEDEDGLPDWWERFYFGALVAEPLADADGDGYLNEEEEQDGSNPRDPASVPCGPAILHTPLADPQLGPAPWDVVATVTDNYGVASVLLRWRRNGLNWRQTDLAPTGTVGEYQGTIPAPGMFGDTFEYRIEATDHAGYLDEDGNHTFGVVYPLLEATPASFDVLLLAGQATNRPLSLICSGNTGLVWHTETAPVGLGDDFESGAPGWTHGGANDQWHLSTNRAASPVHAWYCGDSGQYGDDMHATLDTPETLLGPEASLTFRHWIDTELHSTPGKTWDGAIVEISRNGGAYTQIAPAGGYPYTVHGHTASPWPDGTPCYAGTGAGWEEATFDLSAYAGDRVRVRFHFGSDGYTPGAEEGWYVDDVVIGPVTVTNTWLHVSPASGALAPGGSTNVTLVFDSAGIPSGTDDAVLLSLLSNDPVTPSRNVPARLRVRSRPKLELFFAAQTATDGTGLATLSNRVFDADTESCEMEILYSTDRGLSWTAAELLGAQASLGAVSVSNGTERQVTQIATDAGGVPATNVLAITWDTAAGPAPIALATGTLVRVRVWDGLFWGASATSTAFLVDNEPPSLPGSVGSATHAAGVWSTNDRVALHWSAASDGAGGGIGGYTYTFTNAPPAAGPLDGATAGFDALSGILADGTDWWAAVCAADVFGNTGPVTNLGPLWIDTVPPSPAAAVVTVARSALGDYVVGTTLSNSWTGFTDDLSGLAGYYYSLTDGSGSTAGAWTAGNAGVLHGAVGDQTNTVYVWAQDQAGGIGAAAAEPVLVLSADGDFDRDGSLSGHEEIAGTDATDSGSVFAIESISGPATNLVVLHWESVSNRFYSVYLAPSVTNASGWTPVPGCTNLPGTGGMMSYTDSVSGVQIRFYRLRVSR